MSHKYSDSESRNFLLSALKKPSVKLLDIYRAARTHGDDKFATFDKVKNFLTTVALPREADRVDNTRNGNLLNAASAERVSYNRENNGHSDRNRPRYDSRGNPQQSRRQNDRDADSRNHSRTFEQQRAQPRGSNANSPSVCFKCSKSFNTVREAANHARYNCSAAVSCTVPDCQSPHTHKTMHHNMWQTMTRRYSVDRNIYRPRQRDEQQRALWSLASTRRS